VLWFRAPRPAENRRPAQIRFAQMEQAAAPARGTILTIYAGAGAGSWLWTKIGWHGVHRTDRKIMVISRATAGLAAVFRAPLAGLVFALEVPFPDDLAHEALLASLISSVVAYSTLVALLGS